MFGGQGVSPEHFELQSELGRQLVDQRVRRRQLDGDPQGRLRVELRHNAEAAPAQAQVKAAMSRARTS